MYQIHAPISYGVVFEETMTKRSCASIPISNYSSLPIHYLLVLCIIHTYYFIHTVDKETRRKGLQCLWYIPCIASSLVLPGHYLEITWHRLGISPSVLVLVLYGDSGIYRANTIGGLVLLFYMTILCEKSNNVMAVNKAIDSE